MAGIRIYLCREPLPAVWAATCPPGRWPSAASPPDSRQLLREAGQILPRRDWWRPLPGLLDRAGGYALAPGSPAPVVVRALSGLGKALGIPDGQYELVELPGVPRLLQLLARFWPGPAVACAWRIAASAVPKAVPGKTTGKAAGSANGGSNPGPGIAAGAATEPDRLYLYHCYGGAHTSVTCANLHLGRLPVDRRASLLEILSQPAFDVTPHRQIGQLLCLGRDQAGHPVYCVGLDGGKERLLAALLQCMALLGSRVEIRPCAALTHANLLMRIGGFLSRRLGLVVPGRPLVTLGVWLAYPRMVAMVRCFRSQE